MRRKYYPSVDSLAPLSVPGPRGGQARGQADLSCPTPTAGRARHISTKVTIYNRGLDGGHARTVVTGGRSAETESFHPFDSKMDASGRRLLLFVARYGDRDALIIWDLERGKVRGRYQFPELVSLLSPHWMPDGRSIVVSGLGSGISDIYRVHLPDGTLEPLTADRYQDLDPTPGPDGRRIVFASDRAADGPGGRQPVSAEPGQLRASPRSPPPWKDESPDWAEDGRIYFTSDRDGVLNVFSVDTLRRATGDLAWSGAFDGVPLPDGSGLLVGGFHDLSWNLYRYPVDTVARQERFSLAPPDTVGSWSWVTEGDTAGSLIASREPYKSKMTLDFAAGDAVWIPGYGGAQLLLRRE